MEAASLTAGERKAFEAMAEDLRRVFGQRLYSVAAYGAGLVTDDALHSIALVERLTFDDLAACVPLAASWRRRNVAVPLLLEREEFLRTLDVFPLEYGDIIDNHVVITGADPFHGLSVSRADIRRACELQAKSHLIHLREGYLESGGEPDAVMRLIADSAGPFRALLKNIAMLADDIGDEVPDIAERQIGIPADVVRDVFSAGAGAQSSITEPTALLHRYIDAAERIWEYVDTLVNAK
jgi:hypothetical protein